MSVKLHYAYEENKGNNLHFIHERLERNKKYYCPHCNEEVYAKKGPIREHHFSHKPNTECSATSETILHYEAKHYIAKQINIQDGNDINFPFNLGKHIPAIESLYKAMNIKERSNISLNEIMEFYDLSKAFIEYRIPRSRYIADVLGSNKLGNQLFVIEVFCNHESTEEKLEFIKTHAFPYLEVIPYFTDNGQIKFNLHSYNLPSFFEKYKEKADAAVIEQLYPLYEQTLMEKAVRELEEYEILKLKLLAVQSLKKDLSNDSFYSELLNSLDLNSKTTRNVSYLSKVHRSETLENIEYRKKGENKFLIGKTANSSYIIKKDTNILYIIIYQLLHQINISALIEQREKEYIIGFDLEIPKPSNLSESIMTSVLNKLEDYEKRFENKINVQK